MSRAIAEFQEQHQNRIAALIAQVERDGQSRTDPVIRRSRQPGGVGRPGYKVRLTAANWTREVSSLMAAAVCLGCTKSTVFSHLGGTWNGVKVERV